MNNCMFDIYLTFFRDNFLFLLQALAIKLSEEQKKMDEEKTQFQQKERELQAKLDAEIEKLNEVQSKVDQLKAMSINPIKDLLPLDELEVSFCLFLICFFQSELICF